MKIQKHKQKQIPKAFKGNFTIEMSMLLPLILLLFSSVIYLLFFLYDVSCAEQISYVAALRGSKQMGNETRKIETADWYSQNMQDDLLWAIKSNEVEIDYTGSKMIVQLQGKVFTPFGNNFFRNSWTYQIKGQAEKIKSVQMIRLCRKIENVVGE